MKRRVEINIEVRRAWILRPTRGQTFSFCESCDEQVRMLSADQAAILSRVSPRVIYRWIEADEIHFTETPDGSILICLNSLHRADELARRQSLTAGNR